jgi:hypothetical protein
LESGETANLYGIESEDVCRAMIDGLLEMTRRVEKAINKEDIAALKSRLDNYYNEGNTQKGQDRMSHKRVLLARYPRSLCKGSKFCFAHDMAGGFIWRSIKSSLLPGRKENGTFRKMKFLEAALALIVFFCGGGLGPYLWAAHKTSESGASSDASE